ncbi:MAG: sulfite exporter TauE/SafE family protein [Armatimonadetes bacterium]|nr:sulfite exporter TauE/SafE family protein [Armatimonadota bacterium]
MLEQIAARRGASLVEVSVLSVGLAFVGGCLTGFNPCSYPTVPVLIGLIGAQGERPRWHAPALAATFVLGLGLVYAAIGVVFSAAGGLLGLSAAAWRLVAAGVCLFFGLVWAGAIDVRLPVIGPTKAFRPAAGSFVSALLLGMLFGLIASPCATPILAVILSAAAAKGHPLFGGMLLFAYAVGHGLPLLVLGLCAGAAGRLRQLGPHMERVQRGSGWLLVATAFYLVLAN